MFEDLKNSIVDIMEVDGFELLLELLSVFGLQLDTRTCNGTQMNPYLIQVIGIPRILQTMFSCPFFRDSRGLTYTRDQMVRLLSRPTC